MPRGLRTGSIKTIGWRPWLLAMLGASALIVPAATASTASAETTWLCKPGITENPCQSSEETTVELSDGSRSVEDPQPAATPPIDCFYVYPTVSSQHTLNANLNVEPEEKQVAIDQASRFSQDCKVYAPIYPQLTVYALEHPESFTAEELALAPVTAYVSVAEAFNKYISKYNQGRGFVLIGHSQGALMLKQLIKEYIDPNPTLRKQLVSAVLLGGNVLVPKGGTVGGDFKNIPACHTAGQTHCVVAYSSFLNKPPEKADFGRVESPLLGAGVTPEEVANDEVLCVNPALATQNGGTGTLQRYEATTPIPHFEFPVPNAATPWVALPGQFTGQCKSEEGASWLQLEEVNETEDVRNKTEGDELKEVLGPAWGTHLDDVNVALGNLVNMAGLESATYAAERLAEETPPAETPVPPVTAPITPPTILSPVVPPVTTTTTHKPPHRKPCKPSRATKKHRAVKCPKPKHKHKHKPPAKKPKH